MLVMSMKILIPTTPGGHLKQILLLAENLKGKFNLVFVTYRAPSIGTSLKNYKVKFVIDPFRRLHIFKYPLLFVLLFQALIILLKENPDAIVSAGANIPIPFCYLGKLLGKRIIFLESWSRVRVPSLSGKLAYKVADLFFVQWKPLKKIYPKAVYAGRLM